MANPAPDPGSKVPRSPSPASLLPEFRTLPDDESSQLCTRCRELLCTEGLRQAAKYDGFIHTEGLLSWPLEGFLSITCPLCEVILLQDNNVDKVVVEAKFNDTGISLEFQVAYFNSDGGRNWNSGKNNYFCFVANPDNPASKICVARPLIQDLAGDLAMLTTRNLLKDCLNNHNQCCRDAETLPLLPTRVLDVSPEGTGEICQLHVSQAGERAQYVCLSYCWGGSQDLTLTTSNMKGLEHKINIGKLGKTLQDAITTVRSLGIRYLWVDALCIIQKGDDDEDKLREIGKMSQIYKDATLVLAAACAETSNSGFLHPRDTPNDKICRVRVLVGGEVGTLLVFPSRQYGNRPGHWYISPDCPLDNRAWTFQECALARRLLVFSKWELFWHCQEMLRKPIHPTQLSFMKPFIKTFNPSRQVAKMRGQIEKNHSWHHYWMRIIEDYTSRQMTDPKDTLHALAGIVEEVKRLTGHTYVFGMWREKLIHCLCWVCENDAPLRFKNEDLTAAPSWSWASSKRAVSYGSMLRHRFIEMAEVITVPEYPSSETTWALKLRGNIWPALDFDMWFLDGETEGTTGPVVKFFLALNPLSIVWGLLLKKTEGREYRRIGVWKVQLSEGYDWRQFMTKPVEIWII